MAQSEERQEVVIKDIQMSFGSMIVFMVKWAIATIPALLILFFVALLFAFAAKAALYSSHAPPTSSAIDEIPAPPASPEEREAEARTTHEAAVYDAAFDACADSARVRAGVPATQHATRRGGNALVGNQPRVLGSLSVERPGAMISIDFECTVARSGDEVRVTGVSVYR